MCNNLYVIDLSENPFYRYFCVIFMNRIVVVEACFYKRVGRDSVVFFVKFTVAIVVTIDCCFKIVIGNFNSSDENIDIDN